jgi:hypothetical protein
MSVITKDRTRTYKRWCLDGMYQEAINLAINGSGVMSTELCIEEYFKEVDNEKEKVNTLKELLDFVPKDIRDVATFTWKELNEIFNKEVIDK